VLSLLVLKLGPGAVDVVGHHAVTALLVAVSLGAIWFAWWWIRRMRKRSNRD